MKVHAPLDPVLYQKAEDMNIQMPIKNNSWSAQNQEKGFFKNLYEKYEHRDPFVVNEPTVLRQDSKPTTTFSKANVDAFESKNGRHFFENAERTRMVRRILQLTSFRYKESEEEVEEHDDDTSLKEGHGIEQLCHMGIYESYYPIHDGLLISDDGLVDNDRKRLQNDWASFSKMFKYQPLDAIRDYFGVRVSFYFAWLGVYTTFLVPAAIVGCVCFLYAIGTMKSSEPLKEICDDSNERLTFTSFPKPCNI